VQITKVKKRKIIDAGVSNERPLMVERGEQSISELAERVKTLTTMHMSNS
jgi:hypothetical protein